MPITVNVTPDDESRAFTTIDCSADQIASQPTFGYQMVMAYVSYTKGNESGLELYFSTVDDRMPGKPFSLSFVKTANEISSEPMVFKTSGTYRIPIPLSENEDFVELRAKLIAGNSGTVTVWMAPNIGSRNLVASISLGA